MSTWHERVKEAYQDMLRDIDNFVDKWNLVGLLPITAVVLWTGWRIWNQEFNVTLALVTFTATYTFVTFNQMREMRWSRKYPGTLTIRPGFKWDSERNTYIFGLRNFGTGPAINLRGCAIIRDENEKDASQIWKDDNEKRILRFSEKDRHLNLQEGKTLPLTTSSPLIDDYFEELWTETGEIKDEYKGKQIEFYYTFESNTGEQYPRDWNKPADMDLSTVIKKSDSPRTVEIEEIKDKCTPSRSTHQIT